MFNIAEIILVYIQIQIFSLSNRMVHLIDVVKNRNLNHLGKNFFFGTLENLELLKSNRHNIDKMMSPKHPVHLIPLVYLGS